MNVLNQQLKMNNGEDLTRGKITPTLLRFTLPMMAGAMMQQCYNIADTLIVGRFIGAEALAAVGSAYTLMVFITSVMLGLSMGSGTVFSLKFGEGNMAGLRQSVAASLLLTGGITVVLNAAMHTSAFLIPGNRPFICPLPYSWQSPFPVREARKDRAYDPGRNIPD